MLRERVFEGRLGILAWILQLTAAAVMAQTLFFKFTGAAESVHIFRMLGAEPWGRIGSGIAELIACILLLVPSGAALGAILAVGLMSGAILAHLTKLGIAVEGDGGLLFVLALLVLACSAGVAILRRRQIPFISGWF